VNVLQALILTKGDSMLLTPTYHVFDLYKVHQDAYSLPVKLSSGNYKYNGDTISGINVSASKDSLGRIHISLVNVDAVNPVTVKINVGDIKWETSTGQILTSANFTDHNTFSEPNRVIIKSFTRIVREGNDIKIELPEKSIVMIKLK
jgi:alpha-L-arabinofuranosidase